MLAKWWWGCGFRALRRGLLHPHAPDVPSSHELLSLRNALNLNNLPLYVTSFLQRYGIAATTSTDTTPPPHHHFAGTRQFDKRYPYLVRIH
ncbi:hypothetical protein FC50_GL000047 [Lacticaseibacillus pantheris DSM 15945 = JCM 12539 = NBRC 106106]|uniref:Uncharacterized protein n=1 Tax=Lacticaseibacillus pantheris DSM 15945 = JCM 12539 = NBRC 106106 TaxID=1423783 RepID=A0A0R1U6U7_9LACO|nr:hypothetical protein FC50_GL000047 [Lacticaseibacillus pantheris DSM 15945 = JCM 12539 = NBRC 106106]